MVLLNEAITCTWAEDIVRFTLRELGLTGPMQFRGTADLQGVLFGFSRDEVVTKG